MYLSVSRAEKERTERRSIGFRQRWRPFSRPRWPLVDIGESLGKAQRPDLHEGGRLAAKQRILLPRATIFTDSYSYPSQRRGGKPRGGSEIDGANRAARATFGL